MKIKILTVAILIVISSCGSKSDDSSVNQKELELKAKELELKEKELLLKKSSEETKVAESPEESKSEEVSNNSNQVTQPRKKTENELREELYKKEASRPLNYLSADYSLKYKVFSGKDEINGKVYNYATIAGFKDVILEVQFKSEAGYLLKTDYFGVNDYIYAGGSANFNIKTYSPQGTKIIAVKVYEAKGI